MAGASAKNLDFSGVKDRGNFNPKQVAEGDYSATIVKVEDAKPKEGDDFMYLFTIKIDKYSQYSYPYYCKLVENQLWKLRNIAVAAGLNVPKKRMKFDPNKVVGKKIGVTMADDEYDGKMKSVVDAVFPISELAGGAEVPDDTSEFDEGYEDSPTLASTDDFDPEDEAGSGKKAKKSKKKDKAAKVEEPEPAPKAGKKKKGKKGDVEEMDISDVD